MDVCLSTRWSNNEIVIESYVFWLELLRLISTDWWTCQQSAHTFEKQWSWRVPWLTVTSQLGLINDPIRSPIIHLACHSFAPLSSPCSTLSLFHIATFWLGSSSSPQYSVENVEELCCCCPEIYYAPIINSELWKTESCSGTYSSSLVVSELEEGGRKNELKGRL